MTNKFHKEIYFLSGLKPAVLCRVHRLLGSGEKRRRLAEMGITPNTVLQIKKIAPFGDPIEISLRHYELSIRLEDAANIEVTLED